MNIQTLWVPYSVLNGTAHSAITRLVWLLQAGGPSQTDAALSRLSGLDAKTIAAARAKLVQAPLGACYTKPRSACAALPWPLLTSADVSVSARLLYGQLQGVPDYAHPNGSFTYSALSRLTGRGDDALRRAVADLAAHGWLTIAQAHRKCPLSFTLRQPASVRMRARISGARRKVRSAQHRGETLLYEFLKLLIAVDAYEDHATPDFLLNPYTGELMELDRYYRTFGIAVEFNGDQHYEETDLASLEETVKQVGRDAMKAFLCKVRGVDLVILQPEDLRLKVLDEKLPGRLPRRNLQGQEPLVGALEELATEYRERTAEERVRQGHRRPRPADRTATG